jgi:serine/threonine protein kinase
MGVVYAARDERLERTVALKTMSSLANEETARKRFWREARAAASVNHPNICQIYEIGEDAASCSSRWNFWRARRWPSACAGDR